MNPGCARAAELALRAGGAVTALHVGYPANPALRDYLGLGLGALTAFDAGRAVDALPVLIAELERLRPRIILCGDAAEVGEGSGMLPYLLGRALGMPVLAGVIAVGDGSVLQSVSPTLQRRFALDRPAVLIASPGAPAARPVAFARARAGRIDVVRVTGAPDPLNTDTEVKPARRRPRRLRAEGPGAGPGGGGGPALSGLSADEAAIRIRDFLRANGILNGDAG